MKDHPLKIAIVGSGPAALMAADVMSAAGLPLQIFEKRPSLARKLYVAGASGLNVTHDAPIDEFARAYRSHPPMHWGDQFKLFGPMEWLKWLHELGVETFVGTSRRVFVRDMKATKLVSLWHKRLQQRQVEFQFGRECVGFDSRGQGEIELSFHDGATQTFAAVCFALGGASWEPEETPLRWPNFFLKQGISMAPFRSSNVGYQVNWPLALLAEAEGKPLKNITLTTAKGSRGGDLVFTRYGIEGTPVYFVGTSGPATIDLKPALSFEQMVQKCESLTENLSPFRRVKKYLNLCEAGLALLFHCTEKGEAADLHSLLKRVKAFPLELGAAQPIQEAISSSGGVCLSEINAEFELVKYPGVFTVGEMLDWDAPTGGFLIQACVTQGHIAGTAIVKRFNPNLGFVAPASPGK